MSNRSTPVFMAAAFICAGIVFIGVLVLAVTIRSPQSGTLFTCPAFSNLSPAVHTVVIPCQTGGIFGECVLTPSVPTVPCTYTVVTGGTSTSPTFEERTCIIASNLCQQIQGGSFACTCPVETTCVRALDTTGGLFQTFACSTSDGP